VPRSRVRACAAAPVGLPEAPAGLYVVAGVNGAGKSSIFAELARQAGVLLFDADAVTQNLLDVNPGLGRDQANAIAWRTGADLLRKAIDQRLAFGLETTLGGTTIPGLLERSLQEGHPVFMSYVGLDGVELHIARVRQRVARGGHDVPEDRIRARYANSHANLIRLLPRLEGLRVFDNSTEANPAAGQAPVPTEILRTTRGRIDTVIDLAAVPQWAKPVVAVALALQR